MLMTMLDELRKSPPAAIVAGLIVTLSTVLLWFNGRVWWCQVGDAWPWSWNIWTPHNSQHIIDPYAFTHVLHGVLEFWLIGLVFSRIPLSWRFVIAIFIESTWEVVENSSLIIERYRTVNLSLDYFGDSIINSLADIACCAGGFILAKKLGFWRSLSLFVLTEIVLFFWIRDSLVLNIIMLIYPIDAIRDFQMSGRP